MVLFLGYDNFVGIGGAATYRTVADAEDVGAVWEVSHHITHGLEDQLSVDGGDGDGVVANVGDDDLSGEDGDVGVGGAAVY